MSDTWFFGQLLFRLPCGFHVRACTVVLEVGFQSISIFISSFHLLQEFDVFSSVSSGKYSLYLSDRLHIDFSPSQITSRSPLDVPRPRDSKT